MLLLPPVCDCSSLLSDAKGYKNCQLPPLTEILLSYPVCIGKSKRTPSHTTGDKYRPSHCEQEVRNCTTIMPNTGTLLPTYNTDFIL